jgi:hypothetical protein
MEHEMRSLFLVGAVITFSAISRPLLAQDNVLPTGDTTLATFRSDVVYRGPTMVVLIPLPPASVPDKSPAMDEWRASALKRIEDTRKVAEPFGFQVVARDPNYANLRAMGGGTLYTAPRNTSTGYILVAPMRQARLERGYLTSSELEALLAEYSNPVRHLSL